MRFLFDPDSKVGIIISRLTDLVILNFVFFLTCLPIFTIGCANTALYDAVFRMDTEREGKLLSTYFRSFRSNFRQSTLLWLIIAVFLIAGYVNMTLSSALGGTLGYVLLVISLLFFLLTLCIFSYAFPWQSQFVNSPLQTLRNSLLLSVAHLPRTLLLLLLNCFPWVMMFMNFYTFLRMGILWFGIYFSAAAYYGSRLLFKVFQPYR